ncbi:MAG TPA: methyltransferase dimerization domain-containing protein, partial [Burkholderiaceae bacterium]|nr:methyltransferase dimerization domain-containing protein [Burkholderiaceae bacterium]
PLLVALICGFWTTQAIAVAARLGVADLLQRDPQTVDALATAVQADPSSLHRLLRALGSVGLCAEEDGRWHLTPAGDALRSDAEGSLRAFAMMMGAPETWNAWAELGHSVRTGESAFERVFGEPLFEYFARHPQAARLFDAALAGRGVYEDRAIVAAYPLRRTRRSSTSAAAAVHCWSRSSSGSRTPTACCSTCRT